MNDRRLATLLCMSMLMLAGCNRAETPATVQHEVDDARADGHREIAVAQSQAREQMADARRDVVSAQVDGNDSGASSAAQQASEAETAGDYKVRVAQAEANHGVASAKCESLKAAMQRDCKNRADGELDVARKQAEQQRDGTG